VVSWVGTGFRWGGEDVVVREMGCMCVGGS